MIKINSSNYPSVLPALNALAASFNCPSSERFEIDSSVVRSATHAWDISRHPDKQPALDAILAQIAQLDIEQAAAAAAAAEQAEADRLEREANYVPWAITNADLRRGLISSGINPQLITDYLTNLPENSVKWTALADWEYSNYVERNHPMLDQLAPNFGLTSGDVNAIFRSKTEYPRI